MNIWMEIIWIFFLENCISRGKWAVLGLGRGQGTPFQMDPLNVQTQEKWGTEPKIPQNLQEQVKIPHEQLTPNLF